MLVTLRHMLPVPFFLKLLVVVILVVLITCMAVALLGSTPILICHMVTLFAFFISFACLLLFHAIYMILSLCFRNISSILFFQCTFTVCVDQIIIIIIIIVHKLKCIKLDKHLIVVAGSLLLAHNAQYSTSNNYYAPPILSCLGA